MISHNGFRPKLVIERRTSGHRQKTPMPAKQKWSHQRELEEMYGKEIIMAINGREITAVLLNADAFTVQLSLKDKSVVTYFKRVIDGYRIA